MYNEANTKVKNRNNETYVINLTGNPSSCLIKIDNIQKIRALIDSGAASSLISWKFYNSLRNKPILQKTSVNLETVDGSTLKLKGKKNLKFSNERIESDSHVSCSGWY
jgi:hypothetical protein